MNAKLRTRSIRCLASASLLLLTAGVTAQDYVDGAFLATNLAPELDPVVADVNGNGIDDLIVYATPSLGHSVYVLLDPGTDAASLSLTSPFTLTMITPFGVGFLDLLAVDDMNDDGNPDIICEATAPFGPTSGVWYVPGDGAGNFGAPIAIATNVGAARGAVGDFDGDGRADLAMLTNTSDTGIYLQTAGGFTLAHTITNASGQVFADDFNGDGIDDVAILGSGTLYAQAGGVPFAAAQSSPVNSVLDGGTAADVDGDGFSDVILHSINANPWSLTVAFGNATSLLDAPLDIYTASAPGECDRIGAYDINGDGRVTLVATTDPDNEYQLVRCDSTRTFSVTPLATDMRGALIDLDKDGDLDLLTSDFSTGYQRRENLAIYGESCAGTNGAPQLRIEPAIPGNPNFAMQIEEAAPNAMAFLFLSTAPMPGPCGPQLDGAQMVPGIMGMTDASGRVDFPIALPVTTDRGPYHLQGLVFDPAGTFALGPLQLAMTNGRTLSVY